MTSTNPIAIDRIGRQHPSYPEPLTELARPPDALFTRGRLECLDGPRVAIVGTRRCSRYGLDVAGRLGRELAAEGVRVVSGLAMGIDAAAHRGSLQAQGAPPIGVTGSGLDIVYPRANADLWAAVAERGLLCTEAPPGSPPEAWRFPERNRIIAALADVVVVVESRATGGSLITVREAFALGRPILAVPGPITSPNSVGTNELLGEAASPCLGTDDVLLALGMTPGCRRAAPPQENLPEPTGEAAAVLHALGWEPCSLEELVERTSLGLVVTTSAVARLEADGLLVRSGPFLERR